jgi:hypothetical protein
MQFSSRFPGHIGVAIYPLALQSGGRSLAIPGFVRRSARRFGERENSQDKERDACVEDGHSARPLGGGTPILFGPFATERPAIHVFGLRGLASATVFTRAGRKRM